MKGKIISILLLFGFLLPTVTGYLIYKAERNNAFKQFIAENKYLSAGHVRTILITDQATIHWEKRNKEFLFNGKLYDVLSIKLKGTAMVIKCIHDTKEDAVVASYLKSLDRSKNNNTESVRIPAFHDLLCVPDFVFAQLPQIFYTTIRPGINLSLPLNPTIEIISAPPEYSFYYFVV